MQFRKTASLCMVGCLVSAFLASHDSVSRWSIFFCVYFGCVTSAYWISKMYEPRMTLPIYVRQAIKSSLLIFAILAPLIWVIFDTSPELVTKDWLRFAAAVGISLVFHSGVWLLLMPDRWKHPMNPRLHAIVADEVAKTGVSAPRSWVETAFVANAVALFYINAVVVTSRAMEVLSDDELRAVVRHELAHLTESAGIRMVRLVGVLPIFLLGFIHPAVHHFGPLGFAGIFVALPLALRMPRALARRMEERADKMSVTKETDGPVYARGLEKLYEANRMPAVMRGKQIHPNLYDRMIAAGLTPDYPRPEPPARFHWTAFIALMPCVFLGVKLAQIFSHYR